MSQFQLHLFGEPALHGPGDPARPVRLWRPMVALLALLAREPDGAVRRDRAAALLWPDNDEAGARRALRQLLFRLRRTADLVAADAERIRLVNGRADLDVLAFESAVREGRLELAASFYRGPFLDGFTLPGSAAFDQWADVEREHLRRAAVSLLERLTRTSAVAARWDAAATAAARWVELEPFGEAAVAQAMAVAAQRGDRTHALSIFDAYRRRLAVELGGSPGPDLVTLAARIGAEASPDAPVPSEGGRTRVPELPLVGRDEEFGWLSDRWNRTRRGRSQLVLLRGEPGIGKSRLARDFRQWVALNGGTTLTCSAYEVEAAVPYAALAGALREALHAPGVGGIEDRTVLELSRIVPDYGTRFRTESESDGDLGAGHLRIMDAWRDLVDSLIHESPLLLVVDDLPWADDASLAALHYAWRNLRDRPLMILATARGTSPDELGGGSALVAAAEREAPEACTSMVLRPLDRAAIAAAVGPAGADVARLERRSGGNPLFLSELLGAAGSEDQPDDGSSTDTIRRVTLERIRRLGPDELALLQSAAVLGRQFPLPDAAAVAELSAGAAAGAVDSLLDRGLVRQVGYGYDFVHDVVREVVRAAMGSARRAALHGMAFSRMRPAGDDGEALGPERIGALAHHAAAAGLAGEAHRWFLRAAQSAIALYAPNEASQALGRALEFAGSDPERREAWEAIADLARARSDFRGAALAFQRALDAAEAPADRLRLRIRCLHMGLRAGLLKRDDVEALVGSLRSEAEAAAGSSPGQLQLILAEAAMRAGSFAAAQAHASEAASSFRAAASGRWLVRALLLQAAASARIAGGDAFGALNEAEQVASDLGLGTALGDVRVEQATELSRRGRWDEAIPRFAEIRAAGLEAGDWSNSAIACVNVADLHARRGEWDDARDALAEAEALADRFGFPHVGVVARLNRALMEWLRSDHNAAFATAADAKAAAAATGLDAPAIAASAIQALVRLAEHRIGEAERLLADAPSGSTAAPHPSWSDDGELVVAARARLLAATGDIASGRGLIAAARDGAGEPYAYAFLTLELARLQREAAPGIARSLAAEAVEIFEGLNADPMAEVGRLMGSAAGSDASSGPASPA